MPLLSQVSYLQGCPEGSENKKLAWKVVRVGLKNGCKIGEAAKSECLTTLSPLYSIFADNFTP